MKIRYLAEFEDKLLKKYLAYFKSCIFKTILYRIMLKLIFKEKGLSYSICKKFIFIIPFMSNLCIGMLYLSKIKYGISIKY